MTKRKFISEEIILNVVKFEIIRESLKEFLLLKRQSTMFGTALGTTTTTATGLGGLGGFSFGATQQPASAFTAPTPGSGGFAFGSTPTTGASTAATPAVGGFAFGGTQAAPTQKAVRFDAGSTTTQPAASPFTFGGLSAPTVQTSAPAAGLSFATPATTSKVHLL